MSEPLVVAKDLVKQFPVRGGVFQRQIATVNAVAGVDLTIHKLSLIHISEPTRPELVSRMPSSA